MLNLPVTSRTHVQLLKLSCANCSAPLEIGDGLERFACSYCGTEQIVERSGGIVWLRKVETAIKAVQRGTDRTAAELALVRLDRELGEAQASKAALIHAVNAQFTKANAHRSSIASISFLAAALLFPMVVGLFGRHIREVESLFAWAMVSLGTPLAVYYSIKAPTRVDIQQPLAEIDARIAQIEEDIGWSRAILDAPQT